MIVYDVKGNEILSTRCGEGYVMQKEPSWTKNSLIAAAYAISTYEPGSLQSASNALKASDYIPVKGSNSLLIPLPWVTTSTPVRYGLCFYDKNKNALPNYTTTVYWGWTDSDTETRVKLTEIFFPRNARYFRTTYWSDSYIETNPTIPAFTYTFTPGIYEEDVAITHEVPANRGMLNAIRRARQLTDIKWTPKVKIPRIDRSGTEIFLDWFMPNTEYQGIPYSGSGQTNHWSYGVIDPNTDSGKWGYYMFFLGLDVDFETFMTAVRYPNSIFGERIDQSEASTDSSIYGSVCTGLLSYTLGLHSPIWPVGTFMSSASYGKNYFNQLGVVGSTYPVANICLCDVFHNSGHVAIITDITRDTEGNITHIEISEETTVGNDNNSVNDGSSQYGGKARRKNYKLVDFLNSKWVSDYTLYRYNNFTSISYTPSPYVNTGGEANGSAVVDLPLIPYLGNKARYKVGYIVNTKILIGATGFTNLVVTKDGESFGTFTINDATEISVGFSAAGNYEAHLEGSNDMKSASCYWTVE